MGPPRSHRLSEPQFPYLSDTKVAMLSCSRHLAVRRGLTGMPTRSGKEAWAARPCRHHLCPLAPRAPTDPAPRLVRN